MGGGLLGAIGRAEPYKMGASLLSQATQLENMTADNARRDQLLAIAQAEEGRKQEEYNRKAAPVSVDVLKEYYKDIPEMADRTYKYAKAKGLVFSIPGTQGEYIRQGDLDIKGWLEQDKNYRFNALSALVTDTDKKEAALLKEAMKLDTKAGAGDAGMGVVEQQDIASKKTALLQKIQELRINRKNLIEQIELTSPDLFKTGQAADLKREISEQNLSVKQDIVKIREDALAERERHNRAEEERKAKSGGRTPAQEDAKLERAIKGYQSVQNAKLAVERAAAGGQAIAPETLSALTGGDPQLTAALGMFQGKAIDKAAKDQLLARLDRVQKIREKQLKDAGYDVRDIEQPKQPAQPADRISPAVSYLKSAKNREDAKDSIRRLKARGWSEADLRAAAAAAGWD